MHKDTAFLKKHGLLEEREQYEKIKFLEIKNVLLSKEEETMEHKTNSIKSKNFPERKKSNIFASATLQS